MESTYRTVWCYVLGGINPFQIKFRLGKEGNEALVTYVDDIKKLIRATSPALLDPRYKDLLIWKVCHLWNVMV